MCVCVCVCVCFASQATWYRMENGPKSKNGKNWPKNRKWPSARNGEKLAQKWRKHGIWGHFFYFCCHFWAIFSLFWAEGHFPFFGQFFPIFGFWPVFHSIPGGLTRNVCVCVCAGGRAAGHTRTSWGVHKRKSPGQVTLAGLVLLRKDYTTDSSKMCSEN